MMTERTYKLLKKYISNKCNTKELQELLIYFQNMSNSDEMPSVEMVLEMLEEYPVIERERSEEIFKNILAVTNFNEKKVAQKKISKRHSWKYGTAAAIFLIAFSSALYFVNNSNTVVQIDTNAITLELENGNIKVIEESGESLILDSNGKVIGEQSEGRLLYNKSEKSKELVYNTLKVPYGKRFEIQLSDGTKAHLNAGSSLRYPVEFIEGKERQVFLTGEVFLDVAKDEVHPFIVNADALNIRVLGTQFNVNAYPEDDSAEVVLVEGSVEMYEKVNQVDTSITKDKIVLTPGLKGSYDKASSSIKTKKVITSLYTSWRKGELVFRNMSFQNILKKIERYYDVKIHSENTHLLDEKFNASFVGNESIEKVLENLKITYGINYKIEEKIITIY